MARWIIRLLRLCGNFRFETEKGFACHNCRNEVEKEITAKGEPFGPIRLVVERFR
ncbi:MAG: hypothetical protein AAB627_00510 [Patescibacteria group bacterium]